MIIKRTAIQFSQCRGRNIEIQFGKDEIFELVEFQKWLTEHGYTEDEHACKEAREKLNKQAN